VSRSKPLVAVWRDAVRDTPARDLDATAKHVAMTLSTWMNGRGRSYPGRRSIADGCSVSVKSVDRALKRLEDAGWVEVERTTGGKGRTNTYTATLPQTASESRRSEWQTASSRTANGDSESSNGVTGTTRKRLKALESGGANADRPLRGSAAPEEECPGCGEVKRLEPPEFVYCADCLPQEAKA
jgi:DNA-binding transcriptional regulator YhcF (GntR family)